MAEELKGLIEKIQREGIQAAEEKAGRIENQARRNADEILAKARHQADKIIREAEDRIARMQESANVSFEQAGRDLLISLRREINAMLDRLILSSVKEALNPQELSKIISSLIKEQTGKKKQDVIITLNKSDLQKLENEFLSELKELIKKGIILKPSDDIRCGFIISYDSGKSHFDFTDKALAEYISQCLKPKLSEIFKDIVSS